MSIGASPTLKEASADCDLSTTNANLLDPVLRARAHKYTGQMNQKSLANTMGAIMPTINSQFGAIPARYENGKDWYDPSGNLYDAQVTMTAGQPQNGIYIRTDHYYSGYGDITAQAIFPGYYDGGQIYMYGWFQGDWPGFDYRWRFDLIGWSNGYFGGSPLYYAQDTVEDASRYELEWWNGYITPNASYPWITLIIYCVVGSAAPDWDWNSGSLNGIKLTTA